MIKKPARYARKYRADVKNNDEIVCAWDTETEGLNGALLCISYSVPDRSGILSPDEMPAFLDLLISHPAPCVWYAHNAQYDWRYLLAPLIDAGLHLEFLNRTDTDIFQVTIWHEQPTGNRKKDKSIPKTIMRDSMALFPGTLADLCRYYGTEQKKHIDFATNVFDIDNPAHRDYAITDAVALRQAMEGFRAVFQEHFGCSPGVTTAGSALRAWKTALGDQEYYCLSAAQEKSIDAAYYGGLAFLTSTERHDGAITYDINSSYPAQMLSHPVPYGTPLTAFEIEQDRLGVYTVRVRAPEDLIVPILPSRDEKGNMIWRAGEFVTTVTSMELKFALGHGYQLLGFIGGFYFPEQVKPFDAFIGKCRDLRYQFKGTAVENMAKLMQNSLYGRFAAKTVRRQLYMPISADDLADGSPVHGDLGIWARDVLDEQMLRMPAWSAFITAHARLALLRTIYAVGPSNVIMGDTDSITVKAGADVSAIPVDDLEYGKFKLEKTWEHVRAIAPKVYVGKLAGKDTYTGKCKGIPKYKATPDILQKIDAGIKITVMYESVPNLVSILKGVSSAGEGTKTRQRAVSDLSRSSNWRETETGNVRPKIATSSTGTG